MGEIEKHNKVKSGTSEEDFDRGLINHAKLRSSNSLHIPAELSIASLVYLLERFGQGFNVFGIIWEKLICQYKSGLLTFVVLPD